MRAQRRHPQPRPTANAPIRPRETDGALALNDGKHGAAPSLLGSFTPAGFQLNNHEHGGMPAGYS